MHSADYSDRVSLERTNINQQAHGYFTWKEGTFLIPTQIPCATSEAQGGRGGSLSSLAWGNARNNFLACDMYLLRATIGYSLSQHVIYLTINSSRHITHYFPVLVIFFVYQP